ncbi:putative Cytochrome P450 [Seiridium cardinale]
MENRSLMLVQLSLALSVAYAVISLIRFSLKSRRPKNYPPGPPTLPFIGNTHQFASSKPSLKFTELQKTYGDLLGLKAGPGNLVVVNSAKLFRELFDKRWSAYSGRPCGYIPKEYILRGAQHWIFLPHDGYFRQARTAIRYLLSPGGCELVRPVQEAAASYLAHSIVEEPARFQDHLRAWSVATPLVAICGYRSPHNDPQLIKWFFENQHEWLELLTPGIAPPVDMFPILKYVPGFLASWKRKARTFHKEQKGFYTVMLQCANEQKTRIETKHDTSMYESLMTKLLRDRADGKTEFTDSQLMYNAGSLLDAAVDTTHSAVLTLVKVFAAYPEVFKRVQAEIDGICESGGPPEPHRFAELKYLKACYLEVLRWRPPTATTLQHETDEDDTLDGYFIPKGTVVLGNAWAVQHDPEMYDSPEDFNPDRFIRNHYGTKGPAEEAQTESRKQLYCFGTGRRQCPGDVFAQTSIMIAIVKLVWAFDIVAEEKIDLSMETGFYGGLVMGSEPFKARFTPRSEKVVQRISEDFEISKTLLE